MERLVAQLQQHVHHAAVDDGIPLVARCCPQWLKAIVLFSLVTLIAATVFDFNLLQMGAANLVCCAEPGVVCVFVGFAGARHHLPLG